MRDVFPLARQGAVVDDDSSLGNLDVSLNDVLGLGVGVNVEETAVENGKESWDLLPMNFCWFLVAASSNKWKRKF